MHSRSLGREVKGEGDLGARECVEVPQPPPPSPPGGPGVKHAAAATYFCKSHISGMGIAPSGHVMMAVKTVWKGGDGMGMGVG